MAEKEGRRDWVMVNRAPVLALWAGGVAEMLGFEHDEALTLGRAVAGLKAQLKGVSLGLFQPTPAEVEEQRRKMRRGETVTIDLLHCAVPAKYADKGLRPSRERAEVPGEQVRRCPRDVSRAMRELAKSLPPSELGEKDYSLYEKFRPEIPAGKKGWGASGKPSITIRKWKAMKGDKG